MTITITDSLADIGRGTYFLHTSLQPHSDTVQMESCRGKWNVSPPHQQHGKDREGWPVVMVAETLYISGDWS